MYFCETFFRNRPETIFYVSCVFHLTGTLPPSLTTLNVTLDFCLFDLLQKFYSHITLQVRQKHFLCFDNLVFYTGFCRSHNRPLFFILYILFQSLYPISLFQIINKLTTGLLTSVFYPGLVRNFSYN